MPERMATVEKVVECIPDLEDRVGVLEVSRWRNQGRVDTLRVLATVAAGTGIVGVIYDIWMAANSSGAIKP